MNWKNTRELKHGRFYATQVILKRTFCVLGRRTCPYIFVQIVCMRVKTLSKTNLVASYRHIKMEKGALLLGVHRPKTSLLQFLPGWVAPYLYSLYMAVSPAGPSSRIFENVIPKWTFSVQQFFFGQSISKVAIIATKSKTIAFFSSPPFLLLALFFSFPFPSLLWFWSLSGLTKPAFWRLFTQMTSNFLRLVFKKIG